MLLYYVGVYTRFVRGSHFKRVRPTDLRICSVFGSVLALRDCLHSIFFFPDPFSDSYIYYIYIYEQTYLLIYFSLVQFVDRLKPVNTSRLQYLYFAFYTYTLHCIMYALISPRETVSGWHSLCTYYNTSTRAHTTH